MGVFLTTMSEIKIPIYIGYGEYGEIHLQVTNDVSELLEREDFIASLERNVDFDGLSADIRRRLKMRKNE